MNPLLRCGGTNMAPRCDTRIMQRDGRAHALAANFKSMINMYDKLYQKRETGSKRTRNEDTILQPACWAVARCGLSDLHRMN